MIGIKLDIKDLPLKKKLKRMIDRIDNPDQCLRECGLVLFRSINKTFRDGGRPAKWDPSERGKISGNKTLIKSGRLMRSMTMNVSGRTLTVGTNVKYARIHQLGGTIRPKVAKALKVSFPPGKGWRFMKKVTIPARPFLVVQDEDRRIFDKIIADYIKDA